jgi:hypothetical protein
MFLVSASRSWNPFSSRTEAMPVVTLLTAKESILGRITPMVLVFRVRRAWAWARGRYPVSSTTF